MKNDRNVDKVNAFPVIMEQIFEEHAFDHPVLDEYVTDRDDFIGKVCADLEVSYKQVKKAVNTLQHMGCYKKGLGGRSHPKLDALKEEIRTIVDQLRCLPEYTELYDEAVAAQAAKKVNNPLGTFVSWICQDRESAVIEAVKDYLEEHGYEAGAIVFDGVMVLMPGEEDGVVPETVLEAAAGYAFEKTKTRIKLLQKSLTVTPEQYVSMGLSESTPVIPTTSPAVGMSAKEQCDMLDPAQKFILFGCEGTLTQGGDLRPGVEHLKRLQDAGHAIGLWHGGEARQDGLLDKMASEHGLHFSVVLPVEKKEEELEGEGIMSWV